MDIYLAASWSRKHDMGQVAVALQEHGHNIVSTWLTEPDGPHHAVAEDGRYADEWLEDVAHQDIRDLDQANVLVLVAENPRTPMIGGGRHFEFGYAYKAGLPIIVWGESEHVFGHLSEVEHVYSFGALLTALDELGKYKQ
jgi:nucleoside 2-deoxyribosyltransferase